MTNQMEPILFQASVLESLRHAVTKGTTTIQNLLSHGDTGFGTIEFPSGEMVIIDGVAYVGNCSEEVFQVADDVTTPFAFVTKFVPAFQINLLSCGNFMEVTTTLNQKNAEYSGGANLFYMVKIHTVFPSINVRTTTRVKTESGTKSLREFTEYKNLLGTAIALYCPAYAEHINQPGWHIHFISDDRKVCGHVMELSVDSAQAEVVPINRWEIDLPRHNEFAQINF